MLWREHVWQLRLKNPSIPAPAITQPGTLTPPPGGVFQAGPDESVALRAENGVLQKKLVAAETRLSTLTAEVQTLKQAAEAAKPAPTPADLAKKLAEQRGVAFNPEPKWEPVAMEIILNKVKASVDAQLPVALGEARSRAAVAMGFTSEPYDYPAAAISLAQMTNGGFYDSATKQFFYREEASLARADGREAFIGGLASALTLQKAGGGSPWRETPNDDEALAVRSLSSGDANATRVRFSIADQLNLNFDRSGAPAAPPPNYSAPAYLAEIWKFSQDKGSLFIESLAGRGGNPAIDAAYQRPPRSSAEILHPEELYLANPPFQPVAVEIPHPDLNGVAPYYLNTAGEFGTYIALRSWLNMDEAAQASEGWAGDRYAIWAGEAGYGDHVLWKTVWRTPQDAKAFFDLFRRVLMQRFSIPWRREYDATPGQFRVDDPRRVLRLTLGADGTSVSFSHATDPASAAILEKALATP